MTAGSGVPRVDPTLERGPVRRAFMRWLRTDQGRWFGINVAAKIDPHCSRQRADASASG
jgi:hypothetical protein